MKSLSILLALLAAFCAYVAAVDTENYQVFSRAAAESGVTIRGNRRYSVYEYWHPRPGIPDCVTGWSHVRVVFGRVTDRNGERDFVGIAYDMIIDPPGTSQIAMDVEPWVANHYMNGHELVRVSQDSQYSGVHLVAAGADDRTIRLIGDEYCATWPTYDIFRNNCLNFANYVVAQTAEV